MKIEFKKTNEKCIFTSTQRQQVNVQCNKLVAHSFVKFWVTNDYVKGIL